MHKLDEWTITEILKMDERGVPYSQIAKKVGIPDSTISNIVKWPDKYRTIQKPTITTQVFSGPTKKCPECGHKVQMPCKVCAIRKYKKLQMLKVR